MIGHLQVCRQGKRRKTSKGFSASIATIFLNHFPLTTAPALTSALTVKVIVITTPNATLLSSAASTTVGTSVVQHQIGKTAVSTEKDQQLKMYLISTTESQMLSRRSIFRKNMITIGGQLGGSSHEEAAVARTSPSKSTTLIWRRLLDADMTP